MSAKQNCATPSRWPMPDKRSQPTRCSSAAWSICDNVAHYLARLRRPQVSLLLRDSAKSRIYFALFANQMCASESSSVRATQVVEIAHFCFERRGAIVLFVRIGCAWVQGRVACRRRRCCHRRGCDAPAGSRWLGLAASGPRVCGEGRRDRIGTVTNMACS